MRHLFTFFTLLCLPTFFFSQAITYVEAPLYDNSTTSGRAPNGTSAHAYMRACALVLQTELTSIPSSSFITSFGFTLNSGTASTPCSGTFSLYLQNTTDVTYSKGTTFATCLTGMTMVYASAMTVPNTLNTTSITITLTSPFLYTGGGIYVAYDWYSPGPYDLTAAIYRANSLGLVPGCATGASNASAPASLGTTAFRPCFLWGIANSYTNDIQYIGVEAPGRVAAQFNTPHTISAVIKNASNSLNNNIVVSLNVSGANTFVNTQTITSLASGAFTTVTFAPFNPQLPGLNTISITVPGDQNNANNSGTYSQSVTCNEWAVNPAIGTYTNTSVGFGTGSGIIAVAYSNPVSSTLTSMRCSISTNTPSSGNQTWGVLLSSGGVVIATTNTITINSGMLGSFQTLSFSNPPALSASTNYYLGFAQPANATAYYPAGTMSLTYVPSTIYATTGLTGGAMTPLTTNLGYFGIEAIFAPNISLVVPSQTVVCGSAITLSATSSANTYTWSTGANTPTISVNNTVTTTYTVISTNTLGCVANRTATLTVNSIPVAASANTNVLCAGSTITLTASGATTYTWLTGTNSSNATIFTDTPSGNITYTLQGANFNGCSASALLTVTVNSLPLVTAVINTASVCLGSSVSLAASGANTYTWNNGTPNANLTDIPTASTVYTVTGTANTGCTNTATVGITVNTFTPGITSNTSICLGDQITINATGGSGTSYTWSNGSNSFSSINVSPTITTNYFVVALSALNGCSGSNSMAVVVNPKPSVIASADRTVMCKNESNTLTVTGATTYSWTGGASTSSIVITPTVNNNNLTYSVIGSFSTGCANTATLFLKVTACTGIENSEIAELSSRVYPNPGNGLFTLSIPDSKNISLIHISNALGQIIRTYRPENDKLIVDLSDEANGMYFINIQSSNHSQEIHKILKQ